VLKGNTDKFEQFCNGVRRSVAADIGKKDPSTIKEELAFLRELGRTATSAFCFDVNVDDILGNADLMGDRSVLRELAGVLKGNTDKFKQFCTRAGKDIAENIGTKNLPTIKEELAFLRELGKTATSAFCFDVNVDAILGNADLMGDRDALEKLAEVLRRTPSNKFLQFCIRAEEDVVAKIKIKENDPHTIKEELAFLRKLGQNAVNTFCFNVDVDAILGNDEFMRDENATGELYGLLTDALTAPPCEDLGKFTPFCKRIGKAIVADIGKKGSADD
ncbi:MAG: hypothetical protein LBB16_02610, partial [Puniceicoccales bacterium]|jgi:hypothetical protein|nr:hypothetical protein [Puniceicoccales bacterium]